MATDYTEAYNKIGEAIELLKHPDFKDIKDDLIILKEKLGDIIW